MRNRFALFISLICSILYLGCAYNFPEQAPPDGLNPGTADFSRIAVLGGDIGAGFMDGALYSASQENSIGAVLARQINQNSSNPITFQQPEIDSENGYNPLASTAETKGKSYLKYIAPGETQVFKDTNPGELPDNYLGPSLNNFSVPFLRTPEVLQPELSDNPFYSRFALEPGNSILVDELIAVQPSLVIVQLGWHDVLPYAMAGLTGDPDPDPNDIRSIDATPLDHFADSYQRIISTLLQNTSSDLIVVNIPDVAQFPFFNTIGTRAFIDVDGVNFLADYYRNYNIQVSKSNSNQSIRRPTIQFFFDDPPHLWFAVIDDPSLVDRVSEEGIPLPKWRQMEDNREHILWSVPQLPTLEDDSLGTTRPIPKSMYFVREDFARVSELVLEYNEVIADIASSDSRIHLLDWYSISQSWATDGVFFDGVLHSYDFKRTGIFSSDGTSFNSRGNVLFTNELIEFINGQFGSNIPKSNPNSFPGNVFVNDF
jgi:hypothetical protein